MTKEELIQSISKRIEECVRNAYNMGMKDPSAENIQEAYDKGYSAAHREAKTASDQEMNMVICESMFIGYSTAYRIKLLSKEERREIFGIGNYLAILESIPAEVAHKRLTEYE